MLGSRRLRSGHLKREPFLDKSIYTLHDGSGIDSTALLRSATEGKEILSLIILLLYLLFSQISSAFQYKVNLHGLHRLGTYNVEKRALPLLFRLLQDFVAERFRVSRLGPSL